MTQGATPDFMFERLAGALGGQQQRSEQQARLLSMSDATYAEMLMQATVDRPLSFDFAASRVIRMNQLAIVTWEAYADSSGFGTGTYYLDVPFKSSTDVIGSWFAKDSSTGNECNGVVRYQASPGPSGVLSYHGANPGAGVVVHPTAPWAWATGDFLSVSLAYPIQVSG